MRRSDVSALENSAQAPSDVASGVTLASHGSSVAERVDRRRSARRPLYYGEGFKVRLIEGARTIDGEAIDVSSGGIGVAIPDGAPTPELNADVDVTFRIRSFRGVRLRASVVHRAVTSIVGRRMTRVGLLFAPSDSSSRLRIGNTRRHVRYACPPALPVTASMRSRVFYREWTHLLIEDVGPGGFTLSTDATAHDVVKGAEIALRVSFPVVGSADLHCRVRSVRHVGDRLRVGVELIDPTPALQSAVSEYLLLAHADLTPIALREGGFRVSSMEKAVRFGYAQSPSDFEQIYRIRLAAHQKEGRWERLTEADMATRFDDYSRHIVGRIGDRVVACGRVIFVASVPERSEYVTQGGHVVPRWLWQAGFCESGANAVDPEFQRTDLYLALLRHAVRVTLQSGSRYVLGASPPHLVPVYEKLGCSTLEVREVSPKPGWTFASSLMLIDCDAHAATGEASPFDSVMRFVAARNATSSAAMVAANPIEGG